MILDCITSLQHGADLLWIETEKPHVGQIGAMVDAIRSQVPDAKLVYNNSPSFNWTLSFRQQVFDAWQEDGRDVSAYERDAADERRVRHDGPGAGGGSLDPGVPVQASAEAGIFHHLITLPTYHTAALSTDNLARGYFGEEGMLAYVEGVQRKEIREGIACVRHQDMAGSNIGDDHKEYFSGRAGTQGRRQGQHDEPVRLIALPETKKGGITALFCVPASGLATTGRGWRDIPERIVDVRGGQGKPLGAICR